MEQGQLGGSVEITVEITASLRVTCSEEIQPFLRRFPIGCFGICLGLASQSYLLKTLASSPAVKFIHIPPEINVALWSFALFTLIVVSFTYLLKFICHFEAVRSEFCDPVRVNVFFAPWVTCMILTLGVPPLVAKSIHPSLWCIFMAPLFILELKIYGQWLFGGEKCLSKVANPGTHLSIVGNFVGSLLAARLDWKEPAKFFWAVGVAHYLVVFVTLYQRLPTSKTLTEDDRPLFFLFLSPPSVASVAWETIYGEFDSVSHIFYFATLFLYISLIVHIKFFTGFRFSVVWWSYTFPMTAASTATIRYSEQVTHPLTQGLAIALSVISTTTVFCLFVTTLLHAFVWRSLFPNDMAIAITSKKKQNINDTKLKKFNRMEPESYKRKGPIRNSIELLRTTLKNQQARLLQRRESVYPDFHDLPQHADEEQQDQRAACISSAHSL